jgi:hypothetical protein
MTKSLGQAYSIQTFDQQLYAIVKQVEWAKQDTFKTHILRLGGFYTMSCFVASIGKLWGDGGLKDLLIESSVYAAGTVEQMMTGKQFNRAVRALTLVYEALSSRLLSAFFEWCRENDILTALKDKLSPVWSQVIFSFRDKQCPSTYLDNSIAILKEFLAPHLEEFRQWGCGASRSSSAQLFQLHTRKIQSTDLSIHHHPKVYQLTQQSTTLYKSLLAGEYEF